MITSTPELVSLMGHAVTKQQAAHYCLFSSNLGRLREVLRNTNEMLLSMTADASETEIGNNEIILYQTPNKTAEEQYLKFLFGTFFNNVYFLNIDKHRDFLQKNINEFVFDERVDALDREDTVVAFCNIPDIVHLEAFFSKNVSQIAPYLKEIMNGQITEKEAFGVFQQQFAAVAAFVFNLVYPNGFQEFVNEVVNEVIGEDEKNNPFIPVNVQNLTNSGFAKLSIPEKCLLGEMAWQQSDCELLLKVLRMDGGSYYAAFQQYYKPKDLGGYGFYPDNLFACNLILLMNASKTADEFLDVMFEHQSEPVKHENLFAMTHHTAMLFPNFVTMVNNFIADVEARKVFNTLLNLREFDRTEKQAND